jgi:hypothetical protein
MNLYVSGDCIKCYSCSSDINEKCADPIDTSGLEAVECRGNPLLESLFDAANVNKFFAKQYIRNDAEYSCLKLVTSGKKF